MNVCFCCVRFSFASIMLNDWLGRTSTKDPFLVVAWRSGNGVGHINDVTVRRARFVLGWVTFPGSTP